MFEIFSGEAGTLAAKAGNKAMTTAFSAMRIIVTIGWAIYPLGYIFGYLTGGVDANALNIIYNLADSQGSSMYNYFTQGKLEKKGDPSFTEGIGQARVTKNLENCSVDMSYFVDDNECLEILYKLIKTEGLFLGTSSGVNVMGAIKMAKELGPGNTIVTILCDDANKYYDKMFNKKFLNDNNLPLPDWL